MHYSLQTDMLKQPFIGRHLFLTLNRAFAILRRAFDTGASLSVGYIGK